MGGEGEEYSAKQEHWKTSRCCGYEISSIVFDFAATRSPRGVSVSGFSLHGKVAIPARRSFPSRTANPLRGTPALSIERLEELPDGRLRYWFKLCALVLVSRAHWSGCSGTPTPWLASSQVPGLSLPGCQTPDKSGCPSAARGTGGASFLFCQRRIQASEEPPKQSRQKQETCFSRSISSPLRIRAQPPVACCRHHRFRQEVRIRVSCRSSRTLRTWSEPNWYRRALASRIQ